MKKILLMALLLPYYASAQSYKCEVNDYMPGADIADYQKEIKISSKAYRPFDGAPFKVLADDVIVKQPGFTLSLTVYENESIAFNIYKYTLDSYLPIFDSTINYKLGDTILYNKPRFSNPEANVGSNDYGPLKVECLFLK